MKYVISIEGMGCAMCVKRVTAALEGLKCTDISVGLGRAVAVYAGETAELKNAIEDLGFDVTGIAAE